MADLAPDVATLLRTHGGAGDERAITHNGFSGARITTIGDGDRRFILKRIRYADDWIMRETRDTTSREARLAASPLIARLPNSVAVPSLGAAHDGDGVAILMRDIAPHLLPDDRPLDPEQMDALLAALAAMHAEFWDDPLSDADVSWCGVRERLTLLSPDVGRRLLDEGRDFGLPSGWRAFERHAPAAARDLARSLFDDPAPLLDAISSLPSTLVHGDIKLANTGIDLDTGVVWLFDWALVSHGPAALDLSWFPAVNTPQLPWSPDATINRYAEHLAAALRPDRFAAADWPRQQAVAAIATLLLLGWAKANDHDDGRPHELGWASERAIEGARILGWM